MVTLFDSMFNPLNFKKGFYSWKLNINNKIIDKIESSPYLTIIELLNCSIPYCYIKYNENNKYFSYSTKNIIKEEDIKNIKFVVKKLNQYYTFKVYRVPHNKEYYYIDNYFSIQKTIDKYHLEDDDRFDIGNYFISFEIAEYFLNKIMNIVNKIMKDMEYKRLEWMDNYYCLTKYFRPYITIEKDSEENAQHFYSKNYFYTEEQAQIAFQKIRKLLKLRTEAN